MGNGRNKEKLIDKTNINEIMDRSTKNSKSCGHKANHLLQTTFQKRVVPENIHTPAKSQGGGGS